MVPIIMPVEDYYSYQQSISNLALLKVFHDAGVNVSTFSQFMEMSGWGTNQGFDIFLEGLNAMFYEVFVYEYYGDNSTIADEDLAIFESSPEVIYFIEDPSIQSLYRIDQGQKVERLFESVGDFDGNYSCCECRCWPNKGFAVGMYGFGFLHEVAQHVVHIMTQLDRLHELEVSK